MNGAVREVPQTQKGGRVIARLLLACLVSCTFLADTAQAARERLAPQERAGLAASVDPANAADKRLAWTSGEQAVAAASDAGLVVAKRPGEAVMTRAAMDGQTAACRIAARAIPVADIRLNRSSLTLTAGKSQRLKATVSPDNASNRKVKWSSGKPSVASVSGDGKVTARSAGKTTVTCRAADGGGARATCVVTVKAKVIPVTGVTLKRTNVRTVVGKSVALQAKIRPAKATNRALSWRTSNAAVAIVRDGVVWGVGVGAATITCTSLANPSVSASATVNVTLPTYRALLIGQPDSAGPWARNATNAMRRMFANFRHGGQTFHLHGEENLSRDGIVDRLARLPRFYGETVKINENDITVVCYAGEADTQNSPGAWIGADGGRVSVDEIVRLLNDVPGTVILIVDSACSGQMIASRADSAALAAEWRRGSRALIEAFARADKGVADSPYSGKYKVLTATSAQGAAHAVTANGVAVSLFACATGLGGGYDMLNDAVIDMLADTNGDRIVTLRELFVYSEARVRQMQQNFNLTGQAVQCWPPNDNTPVVRRTD